MKSSEVPSSSSSSSRRRSNNRSNNNSSNETKPSSDSKKNSDEQREKQVTANIRPKSRSEANNNNKKNNENASSSPPPPQVGLNQTKRENVRASEQSSSELQDFDDLPVVEPHTVYIRAPENQTQEVGWRCAICERDVGVSANEEEEEEEEEDSYMYPEVSILPCGHVFHSYCFQRFQSDGVHLNPTDAPCIFCVSLS